MNLLTVGLSHLSAPVRVLERAAIGADDVGKVLDELLGREHISEAFVVSTCNRVEVYAVAETFHGGLDDVTAVLSRHAGAEFAELADQPPGGPGGQVLIADGFDSDRHLRLPGCLAVTRVTRRKAAPLLNGCSQQSRGPDGAHRTTGCRRSVVPGNYRVYR